MREALEEGAEQEQEAAADRMLFALSVQLSPVLAGGTQVCLLKGGPGRSDSSERRQLPGGLASKQWCTFVFVSMTCQTPTTHSHHPCLFWGGVSTVHRRKTARAGAQTRM